MTRQVRGAYRRNRKRTLVGFATLVAIGVLAFAVMPAGANGGAKSGAGVEPLLVSLGGQSGDCAAVGSSGAEYRITNPQNGVTYTAPGGAKITLKVSAGQQTFDFEPAGDSAFYVVKDVVVKGGTKSTHYDYAAANIGSIRADTLLHAPPKGGGFFAISHVSFCLTNGADVLVEMDCGQDETRGGYTVALAPRGAGENCTKEGPSQFVLETWVSGGKVFFKFVPANESTSTTTADVVEKLVSRFPLTRGQTTKIQYDDTAPYSYLDMPFCLSDPRPVGEPVSLPGDAYLDPLPVGDTSCLLESTQKVDAGQIERTDYVFSSVDGLRGVG